MAILAICTFGRGVDVFSSGIGSKEIYIWFHIGEFSFAFGTFFKFYIRLSPYWQASGNASGFPTIGEEQMSPLIQNQQAFLADVAKLIPYAIAHGFGITAGEMFRPQEMEDIYFKEGKSKTLNSNHTRRLAVDFNLFLGGVLCSLDQIRFVPRCLLGIPWPS